MAEDKKSPILIYQMGKVGSMTVYNSCLKLNLDVPLYHLHTLIDFAEYEKTILFTTSNPEADLKVLEIGKEIARKIGDKRYKTWRVITLVREPIARNISDFFQLVVGFIPDLDRQYAEREITIEYLIDLFFSKFDTDRSLSWLDRELNRVFDIDIYAEDFAPEAGSKIYHLSGIDLLLVKLEYFDTCLKPAIEDFLQVKGFEIVKSNSAREKSYQKIYRDFINTIVIPPEYLNTMYDSKLARKFYSDREITEFKEYWNCKKNFN